ncbi:MAG TPA: hypothetical protein VK171_08795 [Fimbriimonas sp.]|nr:hypothetical protein [Fimbriimonas sp.]
MSSDEFAAYDNMTLVDLVTAMHGIQTDKNVLEEKLKTLNKEFDFLRITKIPAKMEDDGVDRISVSGVGRVSLTADLHVSVKADQKEAFYQWLDDNGRGDLVQPTVNSSTLKAAVKNMLKSGEEPPVELLNISPFTRASITKAG